jgi:hypothetical protein
VAQVLKEHVLKKSNRMPAAFWCAWLCITLLAVAASGCGRGGKQIPNRVPVSGRVTIAGQPLAYGTVQFVPESPEGHAAMGTIKGGAFTLQSAESFPGVVKGPYRVSIVSPQPIDPSNRPSDPFSPEANKSNIPNRYGSVETSGLSVDVNAPIRDLTFDLKAE